jgi:hypothetical protein
VIDEQRAAARAAHAVLAEERAYGAAVGVQTHSVHFQMSWVPCSCRLRHAGVVLAASTTWFQALAPFLLQKVGMKRINWLNWIAPLVLALAALMPVRQVAAEPRDGIVVETEPRHQHHWRERREEPLVVRERHFRHGRHERHFRHERHEVIVVP